MKPPINFICNDTNVSTDANPSMITLDFLRNNLRHTGVKEGCREGDCGACTILVGEIRNSHLSYINVNSCLMPLAFTAGKHIVTIEGLTGKELSPVQQLIIEEGATQCGFCTPGFIMSLTGYLLSSSQYNYEDALNYLGGNICRCTGYISIKRAVKRIIELVNSQKDHTDNLHLLKTMGIIPPYFMDIKTRLAQLHNEPVNLSVNENGFIIAGGTDLFVQKELEILRSENRFLNSEAYIKIKDDRIIISAASTVSDIRNSEIIQKYLPGIKEFMDLFGSEPIRNKATLGGNICNASPSADLISVFLALDSRLYLSKNDTGREISLREFFKDYKVKNIEEDELIREVSFKIPSEGALFNFEKVSRRLNLDIACVNTSLYIETDGLRIKQIFISAGGVSPIPLILDMTAEYLTGNRIEKKNILKAAEILQLEISPINDVRGSAEYKRLLLRQLFLSHFIKLFPQVFSEEVSL